MDASTIYISLHIRYNITFMKFEKLLLMKWIVFINNAFPVLTNFSHIPYDIPVKQNFIVSCKKIFKKKRFIMLKGVSSIWQSYIENKSICLKNEKKMRSSYFEPGGGSLILNTTVSSHNDWTVYSFNNSVHLTYEILILFFRYRHK